MRRKLITFLGAVAASCVALWLLVNYRAFDGNLYDYLGLKIGMTRAEVAYRFGEPPYVVEGEGDALTVYAANETTKADWPPADHMPKGKTIHDYEAWLYWGPSRDLSISFLDGSRTSNRLACWAEIEKSYACPRLFGVGIGDTEEEVIKRLGKPSESELDKNGIKTLRYSDIGARYRLRLGKVTGIVLADQKGSKAAIIQRFARSLVG